MSEHVQKYVTKMQKKFGYLRLRFDKIEVRLRWLKLGLVRRGEN